MPRAERVPRLRLGITGKLTLLLIVFAAALVAGVGAATFTGGYRALEAATVLEVGAMALEKEAAVRIWDGEALADVERLATSPRLVALVTDLQAATARATGASARGALLAELRPWVGGPGPLRDLLVLDGESGQVLAATSSADEGKIKEDRPYFIRGRLGPFIQRPFYSFTDQAPTGYVSAPVRGRDGRLVAVLGGRLDLAELSAVMSRRTGSRASDEAYLVDAAGFFVTQPRLVADAAVLRRGLHTEATRRCREGRSHGTLTGADYRDVRAIIAYRFVADREACVIAKVDEAEALAPARAFGLTVLGISGVALAGATVAALVLGRTVTRPLRALEHAAAELGSGRWEAPVPEERSDEVGSLARAFTGMAEALGRKEAELLARAEALERSNRDLEAFTYSVSHDLRAPLRAISGFARIVLQKHGALLPEDPRRQLGIMDDSARHMGRLIDDLLAFSRLGRQELARRRVDPAGICRQALAELDGEREGRKVEVLIGDLPPCEADPALLRQVYANLLSNALKFTRGREPAVIEVGATTGEGETVYFVKDNGVGFDMRYAGKLFTVFQRLHGAREYAGTGVGLAIVQRIVERHGGRVRGEGEVDRGATFSFTLGGKAHGR